MERKLRRWQRAQARRTTRSRGWWEAQDRIDRCHRRIQGLRQNAQHQMTSTLMKKYSTLVIEDLNVRGMMHGTTPKAQADASMGQIRRQLEYKGPWRHTEIVVARRDFPSSKLCHVCQYRNAKLKRERHWTCAGCGTRHERNLNAAKNLRNLLPPGRGLNAPRREGPGRRLKRRRNRPGRPENSTAGPLGPATLTVCGIKCPHALSKGHLC